MSLDITLIETIPSPVYSENITHNVIPIADALGVHDLLWGDTHTIAGDMIPSLELCLDQIKERREELQEYDPPNGWGTVEDFERFVESLLRGCRLFPKAEVVRDR